MQAEWTNFETFTIAQWLEEAANKAKWQEMINYTWSEAEPNEGLSRSEGARLEIADLLEQEMYNQRPKLEGIFDELLNSALQEINYVELADAMLLSVEGYERDPAYIPPPVE